jgi:serine/threonine protein kinase
MGPYTEVLQGGGDVEKSPAPECAATDGSSDDRDSVHNGIRVDGAWKHQRLREGTSRCRPAQACRFSVQSLAVSSVDNRIILQLEGVATGLIYIHNQGVIHGDLKGVRLL